MYELAQFLLDCIDAIERNPTGLSRHKIRHALSIGAPLGTPSVQIDEWCSTVCDVLNSTNLVVERDGTFFARPTVAQVVQDNPALN